MNKKQGILLMGTIVCACVFYIGVPMYVFSLFSGSHMPVSNRPHDGLRDGPLPLSLPPSHLLITLYWSIELLIVLAGAYLIYRFRNLKSISRTKPSHKRK